MWGRQQSTGRAGEWVYWQAELEGTGTVDDGPQGYITSSRGCPIYIHTMGLTRIILSRQGCCSGCAVWWLEVCGRLAIGWGKMLLAGDEMNGGITLVFVSF